MDGGDGDVEGGSVDDVVGEVAAVVGDDGDADGAEVDADESGGGGEGGLGDDSSYRFASIEELDDALARVSESEDGDGGVGGVGVGEETLDGGDLEGVGGGVDGDVDSDVVVGGVGGVVGVETVRPPSFVDGEVEGEDSPLGGDGVIVGVDGGEVGVDVGDEVGVDRGVVGGVVSAAVAADLGVGVGGVGRGGVKVVGGDDGVGGFERVKVWIGGAVGLLDLRLGPWRSVSPGLRRASCAVAERITIRDEGKRQTVAWIALLTLFMSSLLWGMILFYRGPMGSAVVVDGGEVGGEGVVVLEDGGVGAGGVGGGRVGG